MKKFHRRSRRLKSHDYAGAYRYFLTITTRNRLPLFGEIIDGNVELNEFGKIADKEWRRTLDLRPEVHFGEYIIMPDHVHMIIGLKETSDQPELDQTERERRAGAVAGNHLTKVKSLSTIIRGYKGTVTRQVLAIAKATIKRVSEKGAWQASSYDDRLSRIEISLARQIDGEKTIWTRNYYEHIIRSDRAYENIEQYIRDNPLQAQRALLIKGVCDAPQLEGDAPQRDRDIHISKGGSHPPLSERSDAGLASSTSRTHAMRPNEKQKEI
ncbi:hypothetical protein BST97_11600 [Nonlabens spongiae]|uniref:Transposase IS200-like domain-containing protein n=1 Tax=Nonlabens spongiae TaxID=331648 RepID=A0A1W6MLV1_9FLAO|nr:transposase [Nonlabens spongiae]ARN78578.1 hypothetical protein BST97_11600 [Nonlabens spongiae]